MMSKMMLVSAGVAVVTAASAQAQRTIRYEFAMQLTQNNITGTDHVGVLNGMPVGTPGLLKIEATDNVVETDNQTFANYQVNRVSFEAGGFYTEGAEGTYPVTSLFGSLGIGDEAVWGSSFIDYLTIALFFDNPEIDPFSTFVLSDSDEVNGQRQLFDGRGLPEQIDINLLDADTRRFQMFSASTVERVDFEILNIEAFVVPAPTTAAGLLAGGLLITRRRR